MLRDDGAAVVDLGASRPRSAAMVRSGPGRLRAAGRAHRGADRRGPTDDTDGSASGLFAVDDGDPPYEGSRGRAPRSAPTAARCSAWGIEDAGVRAATVTAAGRSERQTLGDAGPRPGRDHAAGARRRAPRRSPGPTTPRSSPSRRTPAVCTSRSRTHPRRRPRPRRRSRSARRATARCGPRSRSCCRSAAARRATSGRTLDDDPVDDPGASLASAGTALLRFRPSEHADRARDGRGSVRVVVRWSAPGSGAVRTRHACACGCDACPHRACRGSSTCARAGCSGGRVEVRWRTDGPTRRRVLARLRHAASPTRSATGTSWPSAARRAATVAAIASCCATRARPSRRVVTLNPRFGRAGATPPCAISVARSRLVVARGATVRVTRAVMNARIAVPVLTGALLLGLAAPAAAPRRTTTDATAPSRW